MAACSQIDRSFYGQLEGREGSTFFASATEVKRFAAKEGYGVWFTFIYAGEDALNPDAVVDVDSGVCRISPPHCTFIGGVLSVQAEPDFWVPLVNFLDPDEPDDAYDGICTPRWFATEDEAKAHEADVMADAKRRGLRP